MAHSLLVALLTASAASVLGEPKPIDMATFDGTVTHSWRTENDPVMGGQSDSKFQVKDGYGDYSGTCRIVPSLQAPGFTIALTEPPLLGRFPDISSAEGIILSLRNVQANVTTFKFAFCDSRINPFRCQFQSFKADFEVTPSADFAEVFLPWSRFSDKWSASTGAHTAENPPRAENLRSVTQLQIWTEGVAGHFHLQVKYVRAGKAPAAAIMM
uniref:NADH:ubiquinone oxidoreductase intermediate-associated protein 30 domain-containing protein n=1 Tax=Pyrodinium bahamense TaxID=73915 RepID=A0A7R9ZZB6_9DINO